MYDVPVKNKQRATRRKHKVAKRSPYARELETDKYRQRIKPHKTYDDWSWMDDIEEYYHGQRNLEGDTITKTSNVTEDTTGTEDQTGRGTRELVDTSAEEARTKGRES